jgi:hypothetical protein
MGVQLNTNPNITLTVKVPISQEFLLCINLLMSEEFWKVLFSICLSHMVLLYSAFVAKNSSLQSLKLGVLGNTFSIT